MAAKRRKYTWSVQNRFRIPAQEVGEFVEKLPDKRPETLVEAARSRNSPIHTLFEWDDGKAADQYRLLQARLIYGYLQVDVIVHRRNKRETTTVRAVVRTSNSGEYDDIDTALSDHEKRNFVLEQAITQLNAIRRRYKSLAELSEVFAAIENVSKRRSA